MHRLIMVFCLSLTGGLLFNAEPVLAADDAVLVDTWLIHLKPGRKAVFEKELAKHLHQRAAAKEPRNWWVYTPVTGENLHLYLIRSCCHNWASFDHHEQWEIEQNQQHKWLALLSKHSDRHSRRISKVDFSNSRWLGKIAPEPLLALTEYHVKSGQDGAFQAAKARMSKLAIKGGWQRRWLWLETVTGPNIETLLMAHPNYADVAALETDIFDVLSNQLGSEEKAGELFSEFFKYIDHEHYQLYRARPELYQFEDKTPVWPKPVADP